MRIQHKLDGLYSHFRVRGIAYKIVRSNAVAIRQKHSVSWRHDQLNNPQ